MDTSGVEPLGQNSEGHFRRKWSVKPRAADKRSPPNGTSSPPSPVAPALRDELCRTVSGDPYPIASLSPRVTSDTRGLRKLAYQSCKPMDIGTPRCALLWIHSGGPLCHRWPVPGGSSRRGTVANGCRGCPDQKSSVHMDTGLLVLCGPVLNKLVMPQVEAVATDRPVRTSFNASQSRLGGNSRIRAHLVPHLSNVARNILISSEPSAFCVWLGYCLSLPIGLNDGQFPRSKRHNPKPAKIKLGRQPLVRDPLFWVAPPISRAPGSISALRERPKRCFAH